MTVNQARLKKPAIMALALLFLASCAEGVDSNENAEQTAETRDMAGLHYASQSYQPGQSVAARVGRSVISVEAVRQEAARRDGIEEPQGLEPGDEIFEQVLTELIDQRLLALQANAIGLYDDPVARARLAAAEERILGNVLVETVIANTVTDAAIERLYEEQLQLLPRIEEIRARHILVDTRAEADEVARLLIEGTDFAQLASRVSQDPATRFNGGDLGYFTYDAILPEFARVAYAMLEGRTSEPFQTEFGWHVLEVMDRRQQPRPPLEEMRASIVRFLTLQGMDSLLSDIRSDFPVERPDWAPIAEPVPMPDEAEVGEPAPETSDDASASQGDLTDGAAGADTETAPETEADVSEDETSGDSPDDGQR